MKTLLLISALSLMAFVPHTQPEALEISAMYLPASCSDSIVKPVHTGENLTINRNIGTGITEYGATGTKPGASIGIKFKDKNGGYIASGDTLRMTSISYTICGQSYSLLTTGIVNYSLSGDTVSIEYTDCILPLNGTNGTVKLKFVQ